MLSVCFSTSDVESDALSEITKEFARHCPSLAIRPQPVLESRDHSEESPLNLRITSRYMPAPFTVSQDEGVTVSMWQSKGICHYARIAESSYAVLCSLLGLSQWRVLNANPLLKLEDLIHPPSQHCLFVKPDPFHDYALILEDPFVCRGCMDFYHCLGADTELLAVIDTLSSIRSRSSISFGTRA